MAKPVSVFINCPFDRDYAELLEAFTFVIHDCGFRARCSLEGRDGGEVRIDKIRRLIRESKFGIHDISRIEVDKGTRFPRFNMPLELGIFLGAKFFGSGAQKNKISLIFERNRYSYQAYCSDISGQDIEAHGKDSRVAIRRVRDWLAANVSRRLPGAADISNRFELFQEQLPNLCEQLGWERNDLPFTDYQSLVVEWLKEERGLLLRARN